MTNKQDWRGKKVTVLGLGIEGEDLARYFLGQGAAVTVSDIKDRAALGRRGDAIEALGARLSLGRNEPADTVGADLVCVSQGVPLTIPALTAARDHAVPVKSMMGLFLEMWPGQVAGITGSSGKTTTTSLLDAVFTAAGRAHAVGGNIGIGLMTLIDQHLPLSLWWDKGPGREGAAFAVLEISHTQLALLDRSPQVACLLNVTPNHLDQFSWDEYIELKTRIFAFQAPGDAAVFNVEDPVSSDLRPRARSRVFLFSAAADHGCDGAFVSGGRVFWRRDGRAEAVLDASEIPLRGAHNIANVAAATAVAAACDIGPQAVRKAVLDFKALPHRIEHVATVDGIDFFDDSIATAPERTLAALRSFDDPVVLLLGGRDKNLPLEDLAAEAVRRCRAVVCFGEAAPLFATALAGGAVAVEKAETLADAVDAARRLARPGDVVLMSPAGTSFDAYDNFERRGEHFRALVQALTVQALTGEARG